MEILVVIAILAVLAALIFSVTGKAMDSARMATCASHLRQMATMATADVADRGHYAPILSQTTGSNGTKNTGKHFGALITTQGFASCPAAKYHGPHPRNGRPITAYSSNPAIMPYYKLDEDSGTTTQELVRPHQISRPAEVFLMTDGAQFAGENPRSIGFSARWWGRQTGKEEDAEKELTTAHVPEDGFWDDVPLIPFRHGGKANIIFVDGHGEVIRRLGDLKEKNLYWNY